MSSVPVARTGAPGGAGRGRAGRPRRRGGHGRLARRLRLGAGDPAAARPPSAVGDLRAPRGAPLRHRRGRVHLARHPVRHRPLLRRRGGRPGARGRRAAPHLRPAGRRVVPAVARPRARPDPPDPPRCRSASGGCGCRPLDRRPLLVDERVGGLGDRLRPGAAPRGRAGERAPPGGHPLAGRAAAAGRHAVGRGAAARLAGGVRPVRVRAWCSRWYTAAVAQDARYPWAQLPDHAAPVPVRPPARNAGAGTSRGRRWPSP